MTNEKHLILTGFTELSGSTEQDWKNNGWTVEHEISPIVKEFANAGLSDITDFDPLIPITFATPESYKKVQVLMVTDGDVLEAGSKSEEAEFKKILGVHQVEIIELVETFLLLQKDVDTSAEKLHISFEAVFAKISYYYAHLHIEEPLHETDRYDIVRRTARAIAGHDVSKKIDTITSAFDDEGQFPSTGIPYVVFVAMLGLNTDNIRKLGNVVYKARPMVNVSGTFTDMASLLEEYL